MTRLNKEIREHFERSWNPEDFSLYDFILEYGPDFDSEDKLELVETDLRKRVEYGQDVTLSLYEDSFPQLATAIDAMISNTQSYLSPIKPAEIEDWTPPRMIGNFEIVEATCRTRNSIHFYALQKQLERRVKVRAFEQATERVVSKARLVALLDHPNLENNVDLIEIGSACYLVSQYEYGNSLEALLENASDLITPQRSVRWSRCLVEALIESHRYDISHLAICPENILIRESGEPVLLNPSIDSFLEDWVANPNPEFFELMPFPYRSITHKATSDLNLWLGDTIAIGLIFFQLLTSMPLANFYKESPLPLESRRLKKLIVDQLEYAPNIGPELKSLCKRATVDAMTEIHSWTLSDFHAELVILESLYDRESSGL